MRHFNPLLILLILLVLAGCGPQSQKSQTKERSTASFGPQWKALGLQSQAEVDGIHMTGFTYQKLLELHNKGFKIEQEDDLKIAMTYKGAIEWLWLVKQNKIKEEELPAWAYQARYMPGRFKLAQRFGLNLEQYKQLREEFNSTFDLKGKHKQFGDIFWNTWQQGKDPYEMLAYMRMMGVPWLKIHDQVVVHGLEDLYQTAVAYNAAMKKGGNAVHLDRALILEKSQLFNDYAGWVKTLELMLVEQNRSRYLIADYYGTFFIQSIKLIKELDSVGKADLHQVFVREAKASNSFAQLGVLAFLVLDPKSQISEIQNISYQLPPLREGILPDNFLRNLDEMADPFVTRNGKVSFVNKDLDTATAALAYLFGLAASVQHPQPAAKAIGVASTEPTFREFGFRHLQALSKLQQQPVFQQVYERANGITKSLFIPPSIIQKGQVQPENNPLQKTEPETPERSVIIADPKRM